MTDERKLKYLGINLTKDMRFFCDEKYKALSNTIEKNTENEKKNFHIHGLAQLLSKCSYYRKLLYRFIANIIKIRSSQI